MSGPKCAELQVESNLEREARIASELRDKIGELNSALQRLEAEWHVAREDHGDEFPVLPRFDYAASPLNATIDNLRAVRARRIDELEDLQAVFDAAKGSIRVTGLMRSIAASAYRAPSREAETAVAGTTIAPETIEKRRGKVWAIVERLAPAIEKSEWERVCKMARCVLEVAGSTRYDAELLELRRVVQQVNEAAATKSRTAHRLQSLWDTLEGLSGVHIERLRGELRAAYEKAEPLRSDIEAEVEREAAAAKAAEDRVYGAKVILEELAALGYTTEDSMETAIVSGECVSLTRHDLQEYSVQLKTGPRGGGLDVRLEREAGDGLVEGKERERIDREMEERWCNDFAAAAAAATENGVLVRVTRLISPGSAPVQLRQGSDARSVQQAPQGSARTS